MPAKTLTFLLLLLSPFVASARYAISGKVLNAGTQKPIPGATVFLTNASSVTITDSNGAFALEGVPGGQYELFVSATGYNLSSQIIAVNNDTIIKNINLYPAEPLSKNISVKRDLIWTKNYKDFKSKFLGDSEYAQDCKILNPEVITLRYDRRSASLIGSSSEFITIENQALGYRIKYLLLEFKASFKENIVYYSGPAYFEPLVGNSSLEAGWKGNRLMVYLGSSMHFLRSALANQLSVNGFAVRPAIIQANPLLQDETLGKKYNAALVNSLLQPDEFLKPTTDPALHALIFSDALYVTYSRDPVKDTTLNRLAPATIVILNQRYATFDNNGILTNPTAITFDGIWGRSHLAEMLPVNYEPGK